MPGFVFNTTKSIINQSGALQRLAEICHSQHINKALVVTDGGIIDCGLFQQLQQSLDGKLAYCSFTDIVADPPEATIEAALAMAKAEQVDGIIGFGGGSSMDSAKLVALMAKSGESLADIYGVDQAKGQRLPLILIPTTAGTGSEVTPVAIVTTGETTKMGVVAAQLLPDVALLDAELTLGLPAHITAATGIDAMVHAIEAFTTKHKKNPYSDMLAKQALTLLSENIQQACHHGNDVNARQAMLLGACLAGQAFANAPVAAVHALAYPLGGHFHIPHGLSNSLVLPHVMSFNHSSCHNLYAELAPLIMGRDFNDSGSSESNSLQLISYLSEQIKQLQLPHQLRSLGVKEEQLPTLAKDAMLQQRLLVNNPRDIDEKQALAIYQAAY